MKKLILKNTREGLIPNDEEGQDYFDKWAYGETREVTVGKKRTTPAHNAFHAFLHCLLQNQETYTEKEDLLTELCLRAGLGRFRSVFVDDQKMSYFTRMSFGFGEADQDKAVNAYRKIYDEAKSMYKIDFEEWLSIGSDTQCQHPDCNRTAVHIHHIFPGSGRRKLCDKYGFVVKICHEHHDLSHGKGLSHEEAVKRMEPLQKKWCEVIGIDYNAARQLILG